MEKIIKWISGTLLFFQVVLISLIAPIDFTPLDQQPFYNRMMAKLDTVPINAYQPTQPLQVGWSQFSLVPDQPRPLAGYKPRAIFTTVHDTIYARVMAISNGPVTAYIISADLLLFPPELKKMIYENIKLSKSDFLYLSASHTHTSVGGWDPSILGNILMGKYQQEWMEQVANKIIKHMGKAKESMKPSVLYSWQADAAEHVSHRIDKSGNSSTDGKIRGITVVRSDSSRGLLFTYGVHPTLISRKGTSISADYPGAVSTLLQREYQYIQFLAGMMGSHGIRGFDLYEFPLVDSIGRSLALKISKADQRVEESILPITTARIKIEHGPSQLRLTEKLKLRNWVFESVIGLLEGEIDLLKIGDILFLGTSCDFSGEINKSKKLDQKAASLNTKLLITSFNGEYMGYITSDQHYLTSSHEEVRAMNWVGPYYGEYYAQIIERLLDRIARRQTSFESDINKP